MTSINDTRRRPAGGTDAQTEADEIEAEESAAPPPRASLSSQVMDRVSGSPRLNRVWKMAPAACLVVAALCVAAGYVDAAFVVATLGVVAWFVETRNRLRAADIEPSAPGIAAERDDPSNRNEQS